MVTSKIATLMNCCNLYVVGMLITGTLVSSQELLKQKQTQISTSALLSDWLVAALKCSGIFLGKLCEEHSQFADTAGRLNST